MKDGLLREEIEIKKLVIRLTRNIPDNEIYGHFVAIDEAGNEHTFLYVGADGEDHNVAVASPKDGKVGWKVKESND